MHRTITRALGIGVLLCSTEVQADTPAVRMTTSPQVCLSPCTLMLKIRIEPHPANYTLRVVVDGPLYRYSEIALTERSPKTFLLPYKGLIDGDYGIAADLVRHDAGDWIAGRAEGRLTVGVVEQ